MTDMTTCERGALFAHMRIRMPSVMRVPGTTSQRISSCRSLEHGEKRLPVELAVGPKPVQRHTSSEDGHSEEEPKKYLQLPAAAMCQRESGSGEAPCGPGGGPFAC